MKKIVIVEDETVAAAHLKRMLAEVLPDAEVVAVLQSIEECVEFFSHSHDNASANDDISLVFMDIHLADGPAFKIFERVDIPYPIVFTTAYDEYALQAFKVNSIDYLLKPISANDLRHAVEKLHRLNPDNLRPLSQLASQPVFKSTFLIPMGGRLLPLHVDDIGCICLDEGTTRAILTSGAPPVSLDTPLDAMMERLDPDRFYRANRQYIVSRNAIHEISVWPIGKLALTLTVPTPTRIIVSKAKVPEFKRWYTR